jgi:hypothetical protein
MPSAGLAELARRRPQGGGSPSRQARGIARRRLARWREELEPEAERMVRAVAARHVELGNEVLARVAATRGVAGLPGALPEETRFRAPGRYVFNDLLRLAEPPLAASLLRAIAPGLAGKLAARHGRGYLERLFEINSARVINDFQERLVESRRQLQAEVLAQLEGLAAAASQALELAMAAHAGGASLVREEILRLDHLQAEVERLRAARPEPVDRAAPAGDPASGRAMGS